MSVPFDVDVPSDPKAAHQIIHNQPIPGTERRLVVNKCRAPWDTPGMREGLVEPGYISYAIRVVAYENDAISFAYIRGYREDIPNGAELSDAETRGKSALLTPCVDSTPRAIACAALNGLDVNLHDHAVDHDAASSPPDRGGIRR